METAVVYANEEMPMTVIMRDMMVKGGWRFTFGSIACWFTGWIEEPVTRWMESLFPRYDCIRLDYVGFDGRFVEVRYLKVDT